MLAVSWGAWMRTFLFNFEARGESMTHSMVMKKLTVYEYNYKYLSVYIYILSYVTVDE